SSPVVCDLNGDGNLEIVFGGEEIYAMHADGTEYYDGDHNSLTLGILTNTLNANFWGTPAVVDIDNDGILDIVAAGWNTGLLYVFGPDGAIKAGWPQAICAPGDQPWASAVVADVIGDTKKEIFIPGT